MSSEKVAESVRELVVVVVAVGLDDRQQLSTGLVMCSWGKPTNSLNVGE